VQETKQSRTRFSILIVEDDEAAGELTRRMVALQFPEAAVLVAEDGAIGGELFKEHRPEIVITDIGMPVKNGIEFAREIKTLRPETKLIVLTAYNDEIFLEQFVEIGARAYLLKPLDMDKLILAIGRCIGELGLAG
jgi:YesN/AraC family two-component response regulator